MSKEKSPAFQFYPKDFLVDEAVMTMGLADVGAYILLLCHSWIECGIPSDPVILARMCRIPITSFRKIWPRLEPLFLVNGANDLRLVNRRQEEERKKQASYRNAQSDSGRVGAERRWGRHVLQNGVAIDSPMAKNSSSSSSSSAITTIVSANADTHLNSAVEDGGDVPKFSLKNPPFSTLGKVRKKPSIDPEIARWFAEEFWPLYPRHTAKAVALRVADKRASTPELRAAILTGLRAAVPELRSRTPEFIPHAATWLNGERWNDEAPPANAIKIVAGVAVSAADQKTILKMRKIRAEIDRSRGLEPLPE